MNPRERFRLAMSHQQPDRVLIDYGKHFGSFHRRGYSRLRPLLPELDLPEEPRILDRMAQNVVLEEALLRRFDIDFRWVIPHWVGVRDITLDGQPGYVDWWQTPHKFTDVGDYFAVAGQPLGREGLTIEDIESFPWPGPSPAMFTGLREQARAWRENTDYVVGADGIKCGILQTGSQLRGYDHLFADFALNPGLAHALLDRLSASINAMYRAYLQEVGEYVQVVAITDDQGTQKSLMVSPKMFREFIKPRLASQIKTIKDEADVKVIMHCDGAIVPIIPDLIEIGVDIINPIQTVVKGLEDTASLKERFGDRVCFHGGIDVQQVLPNATVAEVRNEVARRIADLGRQGGYIIAPCHNIGPDIPPENVLALFDAAQEFGSYQRDSVAVR
ncbi:MAG TPA: uroporphyrinogen decarboxylase family protein [Anaerolineae bacterium]